MHERTFTATHKIFFDELKRNIPSLNAGSVTIVTDQEKAIVNAISSELPQTNVVHCWNHILKDVCRWLRGHGAASDDITIYMERIRHLLRQPTLEKYETEMTTHKALWDDTFYKYWIQTFHRLVPKNLGRWVLEELGIYNQYSGVTTNQSKSMNRVIKDLQEWKEAPADV